MDSNLYGAARIDRALKGLEKMSSTVVTAPKWPGSLLWQSSLAQTFDHVGVVFRSMPGHAPTNKCVERSRRDRDGLFQRFLRFRGPTDLAERRSEPTVSRRKIGV